MSKEVVKLLEILEQKNSYLLEFHKINIDEMDRLYQGRVDNLENFYYSREILLNAIDKLDSKFSKKSSDGDFFKANKAEKKKLIEILKLKKDMVLSILDQDLAIISLVDKMQNKNLSIAS